MTINKIFKDGFFPWLVVLPFLVFILHSLLFHSWLIDDAAISFAYARNLIHGHGFVAQFGAEPVEGFSNPLWTTFISPVFIGELTDPTLHIKLISYALNFSSFALIAVICRLLFNQLWWSRCTTVAVLLCISCNTSFVVWTMSGLENALYAFLCALYCLQLIRYTKAPPGCSSAIAIAAGLSAAGLALTRPDGLAFFAAFPGVITLRLLNDRSLWKTEIRKTAYFLVAAFFPVLIYVFLRVMYFGDLYPNTYHAKGGPSLTDLVHLLFLSRHFILKNYDLFHGMFSWRAGPIILLFLAGVFYLLFSRRKTSSVIFLLPALVCSWLIYCLLPEDWMGEFRFATPFLLVLPLFFLSLLAELLCTSSIPSRIHKGIFLGCVALLLINNVIVSLPGSLKFAESPPTPFKQVAANSGIIFNYYADELGIAEASLLSPDLGGTLYFSQHHVYDLAGLCDRTIAPIIASGDEFMIRDYLLELRPTFIHVHGYWAARSGLFGDDQFRELYVAIKESPSEWAKQEGVPGIYNGDYVLRDAISSKDILEKLRQKIQNTTQQEHRPYEIKARPFPRG